MLLTTRQSQGAAMCRERIPTRRPLWNGQSVLEFALMLPLISLILVGTVDLARAFIYYERLTNAVREGALFGMKYPTQITSSGPLSNSWSADPSNIVYVVTQESAGAVINPTTDSTTSDVLCYEARTTTLKAGGSFQGDCRSPNLKTGDTIQVRAKYTFNPLTKQMMGRFGGGALQMSKTVRMVVQ